MSVLNQAMGNSYFLIAEAGATKTSWMLADSHGESLRLKETAGFNPNYHEIGELEILLHLEIKPFLEGNLPDRLVYYGAGCGTDEKKELVRSALKAHFLLSSVVVHSDLLAAAHALLGNKAGVVGLLGSGSNCCYYNGTDIVRNVASLGYLLGDEGSGTYIGKKLLISWIRGEFNTELSQKVENHIGFPADQAVTRFYSDKTPNKFLSSLIPFVKENIHFLPIQKLVEKSFDDFITIQLKSIAKPNTDKLCFAGSVAWVFQEILIRQLSRHGYHADRIEKELSKDLVKYHLGID